MTPKQQSNYQKKRYKANKLAYKARAAKYYQENKEHIKRVTNAYRLAHLEDYSHYYAQYRKNV